ncbi:MAG: lipid-A-disaccharide synthase [Deltaproteobacteria bacterium]|nr:lipid-A-disaccharide synthase [Deltaproteobacteria bacterium]
MPLKELPVSSEDQNIMVVAGEASGDLHAAALVRALKRIEPRYRYYGVGGEKLRAEGIELIADSAAMAVIGLTEVFLKLPVILKVMNSLVRSFQEKKPVAVILVDYPDFNLILARKAHARGIKVFYYISPQIWAWRKGRITTIRRNVDKLAVILPFEAPIYRSAGVNAEYVGHPLLDMIPPPSSQEEAREKLGLRAGVKTVSLLPGSRPGEVAKLLPVCLQAATIMQQQQELQFILPLASTLSRDFVESIINRYNLKITVVSNAIYDILAAADLAIVASGTATLEAGLMETPMIIIYRVSRLTYLLGRMLIKVKNIGLVNIIAGKTIVPELVQTEANPERLAELADRLLGDQSARDRMKIALSQIKAQLGAPGASERAAHLVANLLNTCFTSDDMHKPI